jgi:hypothetical protein
MCSDVSNVGFFVSYNLLDVEDDVLVELAVE